MKLRLNKTFCGFVTAATIVASLCGVGVSAESHPDPDMLAVFEAPGVQTIGIFSKPKLSVDQTLFDRVAKHWIPENALCFPAGTVGGVVDIRNGLKLSAEPSVAEPSKEPETQPSEPETQPTEPEVTDLTEPEAQPTEPTEPETQPTEPATEPTEPATEPIEPVEQPTEPEVVVNFTDIDETVYATTTVNVRSGPGTDYDRLGLLYTGDSIQRTGIGDNGWSKVVYDGKEAYMYSAYLSAEKPKEKNGDLDSDAEPHSGGWPSCVGTFSIPSVGVSVNCYDSCSQVVVDDYNSAACFRLQGHPVIADHVDQGFSGIKSCTCGTKAYLTGADDKEYVCVDIIQGHNTGDMLTDSDYNSIRGLYPGALVCYTCNENSHNVTIVFFVPDDDSQAQEATKSDMRSEENRNSRDSCNHIWGDWEIAWEANDENGHCGWEKHSCVVCSVEEWKMLYNEPADTMPPSPSEMNPESSETADGGASVFTPPATEPPCGEGEAVTSGPSAFLFAPSAT